jgi:hypothetical protein
MGRDSSSASTVGDHSDFINLVDVSTNTTAKHFWISFRSWSSDADVATNYSISWISPFWEEVVEAFIPTLVITLLAGFFLNWILGQILLAFAVFMVNPSEGLLLTAHVYRDIFTPDVRPIGRCLEPIVVFVLHILPNRLVEVNTFFLRWQYVLKEAELLRHYESLPGSC